MRIVNIPFLVKFWGAGRKFLKISSAACWASVYISLGQNRNLFLCERTIREFYDGFCDTLLLGITRQMLLHVPVFKCVFLLASVQPSLPVFLMTE